ncbi:MAG: dTDP-4-dehydrorhamnose reductase [Bacteroidia bacterium]|jgi:dTDP-4-dehydrorhamnose reductase
MKKILITGSNGLLGQKLIDLYLTMKDRQILATSRGGNRYVVQEGYQYASMDVTNKADVHKVVQSFRPDAIIHTAAMTNVDACELDEVNCKLLNETAVRNIAEASKAVNAHLVALSTDFIFDGKAGPYKETDEPHPISIYGHSKLKGEEIVQEVGGKWSIARTVLVYGVMSDMSRSNIVLWAKGALEKGQEINVVTDQFRTPTLAEDLAMGCYLIEKCQAEGIFNVSGKDFLNIYDIVSSVAEHFGLSMEKVSKISSKTLNQAAKRPPITGFDLTKSTEMLGYEPHSFDEGIEIVYQQTEALSKKE